MAAVQSSAAVATNNDQSDNIQYHPPANFSQVGGPAFVKSEVDFQRLVSIKMLQSLIRMKKLLLFSFTDKRRRRSFSIESIKFAAQQSIYRCNIYRWTAKSFKKICRTSCTIGNDIASI